MERRRCAVPEHDRLLNLEGERPPGRPRPRGRTRWARGAGTARAGRRAVPAPRPRAARLGSRRGRVRRVALCARRGRPAAAAAATRSKETVQFPHGASVVLRPVHRGEDRPVAERGARPSRHASSRTPSSSASRSPARAVRRARRRCREGRGGRPLLPRAASSSAPRGRRGQPSPPPQRARSGSAARNSRTRSQLRAVFASPAAAACARLPDDVARIVVHTVARAAASPSSPSRAARSATASAARASRNARGLDGEDRVDAAGLAAPTCSRAPATSPRTSAAWASERERERPPPTPRAGHLPQTPKRRARGSPPRLAAHARAPTTARS